MRCPRCSEDLIEREAARRASDHACDAHGGFVSRDELQHALPVAAYAALEEARERAVDGGAACPSCGAAMGLATHGRHGSAQARAGARGRRVRRASDRGPCCLGRARRAAARTAGIASSVTRGFSRA